LDPAAHRLAAGAARDRTASDEPVPQPHQELLARGRGRLSRPVRGLRRDCAESDRAGDRDHCHHHGGLPRHLAPHQRADELVQRASAHRGTLMAVDLQAPFIRRALLEPEPPPLAAGGDALTGGRARLFGGVFNTVLTVASAVIIAALIWPALKFLLIDAVW